MRKFVPLLLLFSLWLGTALIARAQTRPRRVTQTAGAPATSSTTTQTNNTPSRPPVLGGNNNSPASAGQTNTAPADETAGDGPQELDEGDTVRVETNLVTIPVTVMDRDGKYIPNLRQRDFRIFEDGVEQRIAYFASVEKPFTVALVIDTSGSTRFRLDEIQDAAIAFINQLRPDDRVMIVSFDDDVRVLSEATNDRYRLREAIRRTRPGDGTRLYDALDLVINQRFNRIHGRKAIVLFTDGVDTTSKYATYQSTVRDAEELDALIYPVQYDTFNDVNAGGGSRWPGQGRGGRRSSGNVWVDILGGVLGGGNMGGGGNTGGGPGSSNRDYERANSYLNELARKTGARLERADNVANLEQAFAVIAEELRRQYSLGYYPQAVASAGQRKQIRVRVNQPNLVVRARDSYIAGASNDANNQSQQARFRR